MDFRIICQVQGGTLKPRTRRIARIDCHKTAFSASPDQGTTLALYCRVIASYAAAFMKWVAALPQYVPTAEQRALVENAAAFGKPCVFCRIETRVHSR
jgi:hypothetical protein